MVCNKDKASKYLSLSTNSSICSPQGFVRITHNVLPSLAAAFLSVGVEIANTGALAEGDGVSNRKARGEDEAFGRSKNCTSCSEREDWTWMTGACTKPDGPVGMEASERKDDADTVPAD